MRGTEKKHDIQRQKLKELFNAGTFYNHLKWPAWNGQWGEYHDRQITLEGLKWFRENNLAFRGHVMVWPAFNNLPDYMKPLRDDPIALQQLVLSHIDEVAAGTSGYVQEWDVINEPYDNHDLMDICGRQVMVDWFKRAGQRLPGVRLALNDYSLLTPLVDTAKQAAFDDTVKYLIDNGDASGVCSGCRGISAGRCRRRSGCTPSWSASRSMAGRSGSPSTTSAAMSRS